MYYLHVWSSFGATTLKYFHVSEFEEKKNRKQVILQFLQLSHLVSIVLHFRNLKEQSTHGYGCD